MRTALPMQLHVQDRSMRETITALAIMVGIFGFSGLLVFVIVGGPRRARQSAARAVVHRAAAKVAATQYPRQGSGGPLVLPEGGPNEPTRPLSAHVPLPPQRRRPEPVRLNSRW